eukprot:9448422-Pyramimonas_sp.AAC.1
MPGEVTNHNRDREADCEVLSSPRSESDLALERAVLHFLPRLVTPLQVYTLLSVVIGHLVRELATLEGLTAASRALPMATVAGAVRPGTGSTPPPTLSTPPRCQSSYPLVDTPPV